MARGLMDVELDTSGLLTGLTVYTWAGAALCVGVGIGRFAVRVYRYRRLFGDDFLHAFALLMLVGLAIARTFQLQWRSDSDRIGSRESLIIITVAMSFFWAAVFASKGVFLAMYGRVFDRSLRYGVGLWAGVFVTVVAWLIAFLSMFWICGSPSNFLSQERGAICTGKEFRNIAIIAWATDISTYLLVMALSLFRLASLSATSQLKLLPIHVLGWGAIASSVLTWYYASFATRPANLLPLTGSDLASTILYLEALVAVLGSGLIGYSRTSSESGTAGTRAAADGDELATFDTEAGMTAPSDRDIQRAGFRGKKDGSSSVGRDAVSSADSATPAAGRDEGSVATGVTQYIHLDVPTTTRSYWQIPGLRSSTRTTEWPLIAAPTGNAPER